MTDLLRRAWDALNTFKQAYPENWHEEDEQVLKELMHADLKLSEMEQRQAISDDFDREYERYSNTFEYKTMLAKLKESNGD